jgi:hypothetical protein
MPTPTSFTSAIVFNGGTGPVRTCDPQIKDTKTITIPDYINLPVSGTISWSVDDDIALNGVRLGGTCNASNGSRTISIDNRTLTLDLIDTVGVNWGGTFSITIDYIPDMEIININPTDAILAGSTVVFKNTPENIRQLVNSGVLTKEQLKQLLVNNKIVFDLKNATPAQKELIETTLRIINSIGKTPPTQVSPSIFTRILNGIKSIRPGAGILMIMPIIPTIPVVGGGQTASTGTTGVITISTTGEMAISIVEVSLV